MIGRVRMAWKRPDVQATQRAARWDTQLTAADELSLKCRMLATIGLEAAGTRLARLRAANAWAADIYKRARARGHDHRHAVRVLARAWVYVIWRCWQDAVAYDQTKHNGLQHLAQLRRPQAA